MDPIKITAKVEKDGTVTVCDLPFAEGTMVEVTVSEPKTAPPEIAGEHSPGWVPPHPNKGMLLWYDRPFDSAFTDDPAIPAEPNPNKGKLLRYDRPFDSAFTDEELNQL